MYVPAGWKFELPEFEGAGCDVLLPPNPPFVGVAVGWYTGVVVLPPPVMLYGMIFHIPSYQYFSIYT
jgi:hypothetical protein